MAARDEEPAAGKVSSRKLLLDEFTPRPELIVEEHPVERARFGAIDAHSHLGRFTGPDEIDGIVGEMDACNLAAVFDLDGNRRRPLAESLRLLTGAHPGRFYVLTVVPWERALAEGGDVGRKLAAALERAVREGARGLKIHKTLGLRLRDADGRLVMPHDPRIAALFAKCGELKVPCLYHVADPIAFFRAHDRFNERYRELQAHPSWHFWGEEFPSHAELMESQERLLERHPGTVFQAAHLASSAHDLGYVSALLDRYPNLHVDIAARVSELGRQPYTARRLFLRHADRILYATDHAPDAEHQRIYMRFLETFDEHFPYHAGPLPGQGRWRIYGIGLPDEVLRKVYRANAERLYGAA